MRPANPKTMDVETLAALNGAKYLALTYTTASEQGQDAAQQALQRILAWEAANGRRTNQRRVALLEGFSKAVTAVAAELALAADAGQMVFRPKDRNAFSTARAGEAPSGISYRNFVSVMDALEGMGEVERWRGFHRRFGEQGPDPKASRWRPTAAMVAHFRASGIEPGKAWEHFAPAEHKPRQPVSLRSRKYREGGKTRGGDEMPIEDTEETRRLASAVKELNEVITPDRIGGVRHLGFYRVFNNGDVPGFAWKFGGRLIADGAPSYQGMSDDRRLGLLIDGERVAEVDISGCHLTLIYSQQGVPLDTERDPYAVPGIPRHVVKTWFLVALGSNAFPRRWPAERVKDLNKNDAETARRYPVKLVKEAVLQRHPILASWPNSNERYLRLMFLESEIIINTVLRLHRDHGVIGLPVHDSVLVPFRHRELAATVLADEFQKAAGSTPRLKVRSKATA